MNDDLIGKRYRNGEGGSLWEVTNTYADTSSIVGVRNVYSGRTESAIAAFLRTFLVDENLPEGLR